MSVGEMAQGLTEAASEPLGQSIRSAIREVAVEAGSIVVKLDRPIGCFRAMLAADAFSPRGSNNRGEQETSGPYSLKGALDRRSFGLSRNAVGVQTWPDGPEAIIFVVSDDPGQGVRLFERGLLDVTSNPNLPVESVDKYKGSNALRQRDLLLAGVLFPSNELRLPAARDLRCGLYWAISREAIAAASNGALSPLYGLVDLWSPESSSNTSVARPAVRCGRDRPLTIAYADFTPNGDVVRRIAEDAMDALDVSVVIKPLPYEQYLSCLAAQDSDFIYSLIQPPFNDPASLLPGLARFGSLEDPAALHSIHRAEAVSDPHERLEASHEAARHLMQDVPIIPVVRAHSRCLVSDRARSLVLGADGVFRPPMVSPGASI
jgi:hypothetical protein